jgi:hypothetical protein
MDGENHIDSFDALVTKCIDMYAKLLNSGMALDACRVQGKMRAMVLQDERYIRETRAIKAEKYLGELDDIDRIIKSADRMVYGDDDDGRGGGSKLEKDALAMKLRGAQMRRELLQLTAADSDNEDDGLNFFFCPVSPEEMERMKRVEVHRGSADDSSLYDALMQDDDDKSSGAPAGAELPADEDDGDEVVFLEDDE